MYRKNCVLTSKKFLWQVLFYKSMLLDSSVLVVVVCSVTRGIKVVKFLYRRISVSSHLVFIGLFHLKSIYPLWKIYLKFSTEGV